MYLALVVGLTWLFWIPAGLLPEAEPDPLVMLLHDLGGLMPIVIALVLLDRREPPGAGRDFWRRLFDVRRIGVRWGLVTLLVVPVLLLAAVGLDRLLGGQGALPEEAAHFAEAPLALLPFAAYIFFFGPLPEELGWRGFALDRLQRRNSALVASLILGAVWTLWHLPLFWVKGSWQHSLGLGTPAFWLFMLDKVPMSIVMTWVYNNTRRSTLTAVFIHFAVNFAGELYALSLRATIVSVALWWGLAILVTAGWGPRNLTRTAATGPGAVDL
ncbi:MAG: CPBP family intramembrane metalloprotease [Anaerolineae bacterium]|nr:CPBP family intramembrane metalloprotease [Anaerolineae bacterium]